MANKHQDLIEQLQSAEQALDNLVSAEDIELAKAVNRLNDKVYNVALDLRDGGIDVARVIERNKQVKSRVDQFLNKFDR